MPGGIVPQQRVAETITVENLNCREKLFRIYRSSIYTVALNAILIADA